VIRAEIREVAFDHADSVLLRRAQRAELDERYGTPDSEPGIAPSSADITAFFVAYLHGEAVACGGLRALSDEEAEIKRMYVAPAFRGRGVSVTVLKALEGFGRARGWSRLVLETGTEQPDALRFYEREGYARIPNFGDYAGSALSVCFAKPLR
jgi:putative acetyltransferase